MRAQPPLQLPPPVLGQLQQPRAAQPQPSPAPATAAARAAGGGGGANHLAGGRGGSASRAGLPLGAPGRVVCLTCLRQVRARVRAQTGRERATHSAEPQGRFLPPVFSRHLVRAGLAGGLQLSGGGLRRAVGLGQVTGAGGRAGLPPPERRWRERGGRGRVAGVLSGGQNGGYECGGRGRCQGNGAARGAPPFPC